MATKNLTFEVVCIGSPDISTLSDTEQGIFYRQLLDRISKLYKRQN